MSYITSTLLILLALGFTMRRRAGGTYRAARALTTRDYVRAMFFAWFPFGPGALGISAQLLRWAAAERMPLSSERSLAPVGIVFGLFPSEFGTIESRIGGLKIAIADAIEDAAENEGRKRIAQSSWVVLQPDPTARPGMPNIQSYFDASAQPDFLGVLADEGSQPSRGEGVGKLWRSAATETVRDPALFETVRRADPYRDETVRSSHLLEVEGATIPLSRDVVIGRGYGAGVEVLHPQVSRRHAVVHVAGAVAYLEDLGSFNGTYLNGERVEGIVQLTSSDVLTLGDKGPALRFLTQP